MINKKRKYSYIKLDGCLGTALHQAVDRWNESMGCTLKTGGETDLVCVNYETKIAKNDRRLLRKASSILQERQ